MDQVSQLDFEHDAKAATGPDEIYDGSPLSNITSARPVGTLTTTVELQVKTPTTMVPTDVPLSIPPCDIDITRSTIVSLKDATAHEQGTAEGPIPPNDLIQPVVVRSSSVDYTGRPQVAESVASESDSIRSGRLWERLRRHLNYPPDERPSFDVASYDEPTYEKTAADISASEPLQSL